MTSRTADSLTAVAIAFCDIARSVVWATVTTVDPDGRPWARVLHPVWRHDEGGLTGWVLTRPTLLKQRHLAAHPWLAVAYWHPDHRSATANCAARWGGANDIAAAWRTARSLPAPYGYDPRTIWPDGPHSHDCATLVLRPWRLTAATADQAATGAGLRWTAPSSRPAEQANTPVGPAVGT